MFSRENVNVVFYLNLFIFVIFVKTLNEDQMEDRSELYGLGQQLSSTHIIFYVERDEESC